MLQLTLLLSVCGRVLSITAEYVFNTRTDFVDTSAIMSYDARPCVMLN